MYITLNSTQNRFIKVKYVYLLTNPRNPSPVSYSIRYFIYELLCWNIHSVHVYSKRFISVVFVH